MKQINECMSEMLFFQSVSRKHHYSIFLFVDICIKGRISKPEFCVSSPDNVMIVRRYSISSSTQSFAKNDHWEIVKRYLKYGILGSQETVKSLVCSSSKKQEKEENMFVADYLTSQRPSSEHR